MTPKEYSQYALRTEKTPSFYKEGALPLGRERLLHGAIGLGTEAGELLDSVKRELFYGKRLDETNVVEECGDILWYLALILDSVGSDFEEAMGKNISKLRVRYPNGFTELDAIERDLEAERAALSGDER